MATKYIRATAEATAGADTPSSSDDVRNSSDKSFIHTGHTVTKSIPLPCAVWSNTVGAASNLAIGTTPSVWVKSCNATATRLSCAIAIPPLWTTDTNPTIRVKQILASNYASDTRLQWQIDWRYVTSLSNGRLVTGTNTTVVGSSNTGASATNGQNSMRHIDITIARDAAGNVIARNGEIYMDLSCDELQVPRYFFAGAEFRYTEDRK
jgi:hypothetical protein